MIEKYTRKDGTQDYGIYANQQSTLPFEIEKLIQGFDDATKSFEDFEKSIDYLQNHAYPKSVELLTRLKEIDEGKNQNMLPTFHKTFKEYALKLAELFFSIPENINDYQNIVSTRDYRRGKYKVKKNTRGKKKQFYEM